MAEPRRARFAELTANKLRRRTRRSVRQLNTDIRTWIDT
jgi:hypothetical protein